MLYELTPRYDSRKSFYKKAFVKENEDGTEDLYSYETKVCTIHPMTNKLTIYGDTWWDSNTTLRHIKEFVRQELGLSLCKKELMQYVI